MAMSVDPLGSFDRREEAKLALAGYRKLYQTQLRAERKSPKAIQIYRTSWSGSSAGSTERTDGRRSSPTSPSCRCASFSSQRWSRRSGMATRSWIAPVAGASRDPPSTSTCAR